MKLYPIIIVVLLMLFLPLISRAEDEVREPAKFTITKVNRVKKEHVIPSDHRNFIGSRGLQKFNYGRLLPPEKRGEDYIVSLRYRGEELTAPVTLQFFYRLQKRQEKMHLAEYTWPTMKGGGYAWTLANVGASYYKEGKVDRWRVVILYNGREMAVKRSATWLAMEGEGRDYSEDELVVETSE